MKKTIEVSEETYELIKEQLKDEEKIDINGYDDLVGSKLFIRTVTYHLTGRVTAIFGTILKLESAAWIPSSGRFYTALATGVLDEVEPAGKSGIAFVNLNSVTDFFPWDHDLPTEQK